MASLCLSITTFIALSLFTAYKYLLHPALLSPLSRIPNAHPTAPFSELWILWIRYTNRNNRATFAAHQRHGPIVRLGPNELSINCVNEGIRTIYGGGFEKHEWYPRLFPGYGVCNMFSTVEHHPHAVKKRLMSKIYSKSYLQSSAQIAQNSLTLLRDRFLPYLEKHVVAGGVVEVHAMNNAFAMDFISAYQFGLPCATTFSIRDHERESHQRDYHCRRDFDFLFQEVPRLTAWCELLRISLIPAFSRDADRRLKEWGLRLCDAADAHLEDRSFPGAQPVVYKQFKTGLAKHYVKNGTIQAPSELAHQRLEVASEMMDHNGAGHETAALALTYVYYELSLRPELQDQLRHEILTLSPPILWPPPSGSDAFALPLPKAIDALPLLHAVIMETLRLHAPIPGMEPRVTPAGGCTLAGRGNIPPHVRVSAMPYCLHRNAFVFPEPEKWKPGRWLVPSESPEMKEMLRWFWAFGSGGRMCIGSHLAMQEIKLIVASIYGNWRSEVVGDEGIDEIDAYTTRPRRGKLDLRFVCI